MSGFSMPENLRISSIISLLVGFHPFTLFALSTGSARGYLWSIFWGGICALGLVALHFIRRKDWAQHWTEMEKNELKRRGERRE
jgi:hypothetical protein